MIVLADDTRWSMGPTAVALGMFDGVHIGHRRLINRCTTVAQKEGCYPAVFTFKNHPLAVLKPESMPKLLNSFEEKTHTLSQLGVELLLAKNFDESFAQMDAKEYIQQLVKQLHIKHLILGYDHRFGAGGRGDADLLKSLQAEYGFSIHVVNPVCINDVAVSSTAVRKAVAEADFAAAQLLLGKAYSLTGTVVHGRRVGRTLGFPTANLDFPVDKQLPPNGVYAVWASLPGRLERHPAVLNQGMRPTFHRENSAIEVHLLGYDRDLYGQVLTIEYSAFLRPEKVFASSAELKVQVMQDKQNAQRILASSRG